MKNLLRLISKHIIDILLIITVIISIITSYISNNNFNRLLNEFEKIKIENQQLKQYNLENHCNCNFKS